MTFRSEANHGVMFQLAVLLCGVLLATGVLANSITGRVVGIADGDTLTVLDASKRQHKVRLQGIDAPEKAQPFGDVSRQHLAKLVFGQVVTVEISKQDRYKRDIGTVFIDGVDANLAQVRAGLAWHYKAYAREQHAVDRWRYAAAEQEARDARRGLWQNRHAIAPWDFRKARRSK